MQSFCPAPFLHLPRRLPRDLKTRPSGLLSDTLGDVDSESAPAPRLSPVQLSEARRASGNLGGRPRKPTQAEARAAALEELVPAAIKSLAAHLGDGDASAWRAALRVFELSYGKPAETLEDAPEDIDPFHVADLTRAERTRLVAQVVARYPQLEELAPATHDATR